MILARAVSIAKRIEDLAAVSSPIGTRKYMAPEQYLLDLSHAFKKVEVEVDKPLKDAREPTTEHIHDHAA